jgi:hypothetical protein
MVENVNKYAQMRATALQAQKNWRDRDERVRQFIMTLVKGWEDYCEIPFTQIEYLRSDRAADNERRFRRSRDGDRYELPLAIAYDEETDEWSVGISIAFGRPGVSPELSVKFGIFVNERQSKFNVRIGPSEARAIDVNIESQCAEFYAALFEEIMDAFRSDPKPKRKVLGFALNVE